MNKLKQKASDFFSVKNHGGFTLIELLVVVAIIGMLVSVIMVSMDTSRRKSRDAKRFTDIDQVKSGLDLFYLHAGGYPDPSLWIPNGNLTCNGLQIMRIPQDSFAGYSYDYTEGGNPTNGACTGVVYSTYKVRFATENDSHLGPPSNYYLHPGGITLTPPF